MREFAVAVLFAVLLFSFPAPAAKKAPVVGGPCAYDEYPGYCTVTGRDKSGYSIFTFVGQVGDADVSLEKNSMADGMSMQKGSMPCKLLFIRKGTCTPCVFSIGECGEKAWELFRSSGKIRKKR